MPFCRKTVTPIDLFSGLISMLSLFRSLLEVSASSFLLKIILALITARATSNDDVTCLDFACSNFAKKSKRLLLVYSPESTRVISTFWCFTIEGSRVRRHKGVLIIQISFRKMFVNLLSYSSPQKGISPLFQLKTFPLFH